MLRLYAVQDQLQVLSTFVDTLRIQSAVMNELHAESGRRERDKGGGGRKSKQMHVDDFEM